MLHNTAAKHGAKYLGSTPCNGIKCGITTAVIFAAAANPVRVHKRHGQYFAECNNGDGRKRYPFGFRKNIDDDKADAYKQNATGYKPCVPETPI